MVNVPYHTHEFAIPTPSEEEARLGVSTTSASHPLAVKQSIDSEIGVTLASYAQGLLASTALQAADASLVATTGNFSDLIGIPIFGSLAFKSSVNNSDWSGADLSIANGGTGASTPSAARNNLELGTAATANASDFAQIATLAADTGSSLVTYKRNTANQSGGGTTTTIARPVFEVLSEYVSMYDYIPRNIQADLRTGLYSGDVSTYFEAAATQNNPGASYRWGAKIHVPMGRYPIGGTGIPLQDAIEWEGENKEGTRLIQMGDNPVFRSLGTDTNPVGRCAVRKFSIEGSGVGNYYGYGIELAWMHNPVIEDIQFQALRWCITQQYTVNAVIRGCDSIGSPNTIYGILWMKQLDVNSYSQPNTARMSDCYFVGSSIGVLAHGANGLQTSLVSLLQCTNRFGYFQEVEKDGSAILPNSSSPVRFMHLDSIKCDSVNGKGAPMHFFKGSLTDVNDIRVTSLWCGNVIGSAGAEGILFYADGVDNLIISALTADDVDRHVVALIGCTKASITGVTARGYGRANTAAKAAILVQGGSDIAISSGEYGPHSSLSAPEGVRLNSATRVTVNGNGFMQSSGNGVILSSTTRAAVSANTFVDGVTPVVEGGAADRNRIIGNVCTVAPTVVGANTLRAFNNTSTT